MKIDVLQLSVEGCFEDLININVSIIVAVTFLTLVLVEDDVLVLYVLWYSSFFPAKSSEVVLLCLIRFEGFLLLSGGFHEAKPSVFLLSSSSMVGSESSSIMVSVTSIASKPE